MARWELRQVGGGEPASGSRPMVLVLRGRLDPTDIAQLRLPLRLVHDEPDVPILVCCVEGVVQPTLGTVDALARLQVLARRLDHPLVLRGVSDDLHGLIELVGLAEHLPCLGGRARS